MDRDLLRDHLADLHEGALHSRHEFALLKLVRAVRDEDTLDTEIADAAFVFLRDWSGHVLRRKSARFGLVLWHVRDDAACAGWVADWDARQKADGGFAGWYEGYTNYGRAVAA